MALKPFIRPIPCTLVELIVWERNGHYPVFGDRITYNVLLPVTVGLLLLILLIPKLGSS